MNLKPFDWNVMVVGYWNLAILTPAGIARKLFELEKDIPIKIEVPFDGLAPYRVKHEDLTVTAEKKNLIIYANSPHYEILDHARTIALRAIEKLPETPLIAAGFNVRVKAENPSSDLLNNIIPPLDALLSDAEFTIRSRVLRRTMKCDDGFLNFSIETEQDEDVKVEFNFHRESHVPSDLTDWLKYPIDKVQEIVASLFEKVIHISVGDLGK